METKLWTKKQVERLNRWQKTGYIHAYTCPGNGSKSCPQRDLIATEDGWVCACGNYTQTTVLPIRLYQDPPGFLFEEAESTEGT
jgi:hypothetical protein